MKQYIKPKIINAHWPELVITKRSLFSQSLSKYWQPNQNNQKTEHLQMQTNRTHKGGHNKHRLDSKYIPQFNKIKYS